MCVCLNCPTSWKPKYSNNLHNTKEERQSPVYDFKNWQDHFSQMVDKNNNLKSWVGMNMSYRQKCVTSKICFVCLIYPTGWNPECRKNVQNTKEERQSPIFFYKTSKSVKIIFHKWKEKKNWNHGLGWTCQIEKWFCYFKNVLFVWFIPRVEIQNHEKIVHNTKEERQSPLSSASTKVQHTPLNLPP